MTSLDDILITSALYERQPPPSDPALELAALKDLVHQFAVDPGALLQRLVDVALELCGAGTSGVSLLEPGTSPGQGLFRWVALGGAYRQYAGGTTPEAFSPCGVCLQRGTAQLYAYPARVFTYLSAAHPEIVEGLVVPLRSGLDPEVLGTIWVIAHDARRFTTRELSILTELADFTAAAVALQRARTRAEAADRAKDEFLAVVSHELRRPLTAMVGWSELLLSGTATPAMAARAISALCDNAHRQEAMVEDLLDAARTLTGTLHLNEGPMDLAAVTRSAIEVVADVAAERGLEISQSTPPRVPFYGDADRLHQVVGNLIGNAVKFTRPGGRVHVAIAQTAEAVEILVTDTGVGIAPDMIPVIFDAFRTADASSTRRGSGLGLGLTIAERLVKLHEGTIHVQSAGKNSGAQFTVRLPLSRVLDPSLPARRVEPPGTRLKLNGIRVLVVDDEPDTHDMLAAVLETAGASVITAAGVGPAMTVLARETIDVLVSDIAMPEADGYDLMTRLRASRLARTPRSRIAVTALAAPRDRQRILAAGFDHCLAKPVDLPLLLSLIAAAPVHQMEAP